MTTYVLKTILCGAIFYAFYSLVLSREKILVFNRFYLLGSLLVSFLIPLITFEVTASPTIADKSTPVFLIGSIVDQTKNTNLFQPYLPFMAWTITTTVSIAFLIRFIKNILQLKRTIANNKQIYLQQGVRLSLLNNPIAPFSFLNTIFLNKTEYQQDKVEQEVLAHELAHIKQKHSLDILFVELIQIVIWFNPIIYLYKRSIKINHELLADTAVVKRFDDVRNYQNILLRRVAALSSVITLTSNLNFFTTKKRLVMLHRKYNKKRVILATFALIPMLSIAVFAGCNSVEKKQEPAGTNKAASKNIVNDSATNALINSADSQHMASPTSTVNPGNKKTIIGDVSTVEKKRALELKYNTSVPPLSSPKIEIRHFKIPKVVKDMGPRKFDPPKIVPDASGPGVTDAEMKEYETLVSDVKIANGEYKNDPDKLVKIHSIYMKMTAQQRGNVSALPPPPPPPKEN